MKIRKTFLSTISMYLLYVMFTSCSTGESAPKTDPLIEKVNDLLLKMTLEEKVGQMTQVTIDMILKEGKTTEVDMDKLRTALIDKKVGSILNVSGHAYSLNQWHSVINKIQRMAVMETKNRIPVIYGIDAIHGANYTLNSTLYPHNIGMAASRNDVLVEKIAKATAMEVRASGIRWNFDPVVGLGRQPLWPRFEETFGEDVHISKKMGAAAIRGYEGDGLSSPTAVASCIKHYIGYSIPNSGKDRTPAHIPEIILREYFLPPFQAAINAGVSTLMVNSGEINGMPVHASKYLLHDVLREELGFKGVVVTDWEDIKRIMDRHQIAKSQKEAVRLAIEAGIDMSMVPLDYSFYDLLVELVKEGAVSEERIDTSVRRILLLKHKLGLFDNAFPEPAAKENFQLKAYPTLAMESALESIVLAKNSRTGGKALLPLSKTTKVLLAGPGANNLSSLHGSWSFTWQGQEQEYYPKSTSTIKTALEKSIGKENVICRSVADYSAPANYSTTQLIKDAKEVEHIILCLGENAYAESPGIISNLDLPREQALLIEAAVNTGKSVILIMTEGRPRIIGEIVKDVEAVFLAFRPGSKGAEALAQLIFGEENPSGILPISYPKASGDIVFYDHKLSEKIREPAPGQFDLKGYDPQWPFGHGLSYTRFSYGPINSSKNSFGNDETVTFSINVSNTGKRDGKVSVELYSRDHFASISPNQKRLRKYKKVTIPAGASKEVSFEVNKDDLSFIGAEGKRITEEGDFDIMIGDQKLIVSYTTDL